MLLAWEEEQGVFHGDEVENGVSLAALREGSDRCGWAQKR